MSTNVEFLISRDSREETTLALVTAKVTSEELMSGPKFLGALKKALTAWVNETEDGAAAWDNSSWDFNLGDLSMEQPFSQVLKTRLEAHGIYELDIEVMSSNRAEYNWVYDTVLVDEADLADLKEKKNEKK